MSANQTGLAAVVAAAGGEAISREQYEQAVATARAEGLAAGRAEAGTTARAEGVQEGAAAERARILGIEAHALPGHAALIASMKADPAVTPDMAAGRILAAERALREKQMGGIAAVETITSVVGAAPRAAAEPAPPAKATDPAGWKAEYEASADLRAEFMSVESYVSYRQGVADGRIRLKSAA